MKNYVKFHVDLNSVHITLEMFIRIGFLMIPLIWTAKYPFVKKETKFVTKQRPLLKLR